MVKKNSIYIFGVLIFICFVFIYIKQKEVDKPMTKGLIITKLISKLDLYQSFIDSFNRKIFIDSYKNIIEKIPYSNESKFVIGERLKLSIDTIIIEIFAINIAEKISRISVIKSNNGQIEESEYENKTYYPEYSISCNEHYFYIPKLVNYKYDSYSLTIIDGQNYYDTKIFFSNTYDSFINIKCPCDNRRVEDILQYIEQQFNNQPNKYK